MVLKNPIFNSNFHISPVSTPIFFTQTLSQFQPAPSRFISRPLRDVYIIQVFHCMTITLCNFQVRQLYDVLCNILSSSFQRRIMYN